jgi:O-antigen/teichoic acid export membrane protein
VNRPDGYVDMGVFAAASRWYFGVLFVPTAVAGIVLPMLANLHAAGDSDAFRSVFRANVGVSVIFTAVPAAVLVAFASPIMSLYGPAYTAGGPVLAILAIAAVPTALNTVLGQAIVSIGSIGWRLGFDLLLAAVLTGAAWWLIPTWGASGLAWAYVGAFAITSAALAFFLRPRPSVRSDG